MTLNAALQFLALRRNTALFLVALGLAGTGDGTAKVPLPLKSGFWKLAHDSRTDFAMTLGVLFLRLVGAGARPLNAWRQRRSAPTGAAQDRFARSPI